MHRVPHEMTATHWKIDGPFLGSSETDKTALLITLLEKIGAYDGFTPAASAAVLKEKLKSAPAQADAELALFLQSLD